MAILKSAGWTQTSAIERIRQQSYHPIGTTTKKTTANNNEKKRKNQQKNREKEKRY